MLSYRLIIAMTILIVFTFHSKASSQCAPLYTFTGEAADDALGWSVSGAGDFDGDGYDDVVIGAIRSDAGGAESGQVYVFSGKTGDTLYVIKGEQSGNQLGGAVHGVSGIGDFNGDGYDDIVIGARFYSGVGSNSGRAYVFLGGPGPYPVSTGASNADMIINGVSTGDRLGYSTSGAGDVNGDSYDDFIIGATQDYSGGSAVGRAYVFFGGPGPLPSTISASAADIILKGEASGHFFGLSVAGAGDVNSDGFDDLLVGAPQDISGGTGGRAYVFLGGSGPYPKSVLASNADMTFSGESSGDRFGESSSNAGDINADGYADLVVGAPYNDAGNTDAGRAYVFLGSSVFASMRTAATADIIFEGSVANGWFGTIVSGVGDVNCDGAHDLLISATPWDYASPNDSGHAFLFHGGFGPYPASVSASSADIVFTGEAVGDLFGGSSSGVGDVNGDGCTDLIIGAPKNDVGGADAGRAYVFSCGQPIVTVCNYALQFDGTDRVQIPHDTSLSFAVGADFTLELWMNPSDTSGIKHIIGKRVAAASQCEGVEYQLALDGGQPTSLQFGTSPSNLNIKLYSSSFLTPDTWVHIAVTYDGTTLRMYLDGVLNATQIVPFGQPDTANLTIGASSNCGNSFVGLIDEVRIWDVTRSASQISDFYDKRLDGTTTGLVGYWNFDEDSLDQNVVDISPFNNNGTLGFDLLEGSDDPIRVTSTVQFTDLIPCNSAPVAVCQDITLAAGENCTADGSIDNGSFDPDGDPIVITQVPAGPYPIGTTLVSLTVTDDNGSSSTCEATVSVTEGQGNIGGNVSTICNGVSDYALAVPIDVFDSLGNLVASTNTASDGSFEISGLPSGQSYTVGIIPPLGFSADYDEQSAEVICGDTTTVNFILTCVEISSSPRTIGFWKHQLGVALGGNGQGQVDAATLCGYLDMIAGHFNTNEINQVIVYDPPSSGACADKLQVAKELLNLKGNVSMTSRAKQQLTALLLNVAAGYISQTEIISADGATVSQAITYCDNLIDDPNGDHEKAKTICDDINNNIQVATGVIPLSTVNIAYRNVIRPDEYALLQNYPNPFNPATEISFHLPVAGQVILEVYNINGQKVTTLLNGKLESGFHSVTFDGSTVASGIYFYRLTSGEYIETKKMLLLK